jgi:LPS-assembly protein
MQLRNNQQIAGQPVKNPTLLALSMLAYALLLQIPQAAQAAESEWLLCRNPIVTRASNTEDSKTAAGPVTGKETAGGAWNFSADQAEVEGKQYQLRGNVVGERGAQRLSADRLHYDEQNDTAQADGHVRYENAGRVLTSESARFQLSADTGQFSPARFWLTDKHIRGEAETLELLGSTRTRLQSASFTTCDEGDNAWLLKASSLELDSVANEGVARHARVSFMHVPIFYFPYLSFPLEGRKTGFLAPSFGTDSVSGTELTLPWYWNIAPDRDATITPRIMSKRGTLLEGEFRYLNENSQGQLEVAGIARDRVFGDERNALTFTHNGTPAPRWRTGIDYRFVSDQDYLNDFGGELATSSTTHLARRGELDYRGDTWQANLLLQGYQTLDENLAVIARPYQRLPQLRVASREWLGPAGLTLGVAGEAVRFDRAEGVVGTRLDLQSQLAWAMRGAPGFLIPKLTLRHTRYALQDSLHEVDPSADANPSRSLPLFSLDSGLVFERDLSGWGRAQRQTLEPRLFYLYVPKRQQADLIVDTTGQQRVFDSSLALFGFDQLFRENRFNGTDRIGDANQLSAALTTRFLDDQGRELLNAGIGRIVYFRDREVTLPGQMVETATRSDWLAQLKSHWTATQSTSASLQWNDQNDEVERGTLDWRYQKDARHVLRLGYRFERDIRKQIDIAGMWPVTAHWKLVGRWLRSVREQVTLESLAGIEYQSCCWAVRAVQRRYRVDTSADAVSDSIWVQLELKGLTSLGRKVEDLLARDILAP